MMIKFGNDNKKVAKKQPLSQGLGTTYSNFECSLQSQQLNTRLCEQFKGHEK